MGESKNECRWGVCLDINAGDPKLFQAVVQYITNDMDSKDNCLAAGLNCSDKVTLVSPVSDVQIDKAEIRELREAPRYVYGECVSPCDHPGMTGVVVRIGWHFKSGRCFYTIKIGQKIKSGRYFEDELISRETDRKDMDQ